MNDRSIDATDTALLCAGGGVHSSYSAGLVMRLIAENVRFGWAGGVSSGAVQLASLISHDAQRIRRCFEIYRTSHRRHSWKAFVTGQGFFNPDYIYESSIMEQDVTFDFSAFQADPTPLCISATRADTGEPTLWFRHDMDDKVNLSKRLQATTAMPQIYPPVFIGGVAYVDGMLGSHGGFLTAQAEKAGFTKFLVIFSRPRNYWKRSIPNDWMIRRSLRDYPALAQAVIDRPSAYNDAKQHLLELEARGRAMLFFPDNFPARTRDINPRRTDDLMQRGVGQANREWPVIEKFLTTPIGTDPNSRANGS